jgi:hypothetical protein
MNTSRTAAPARLPRRPRFTPLIASRFFYGAFVCVAAVAAAGVAAGWHSPRPAEPHSVGHDAPPALAAATLSATAAAADRPQGERVETESVTITAEGFRPSEITRPRGRFFLSVTNHSGLDDLDLRLTTEAGGGGAFHTRARKHSWSGEVDPPPGRYVLTEANHPDWRCVVTITAR